MKRSRRDYDAWADRLAAAESTSRHDPVAELINALQSAGQDEVHHSVPSPETLAVETVRAAKSASDRRGGPSRAPLSLRWRQRAMLSTFLSTLFGKLALGAVGVALAAGGLGATGHLPEQMQQRTADVMARIGITIPAGAAQTPTLPTQASDTAKAAVAADHPASLPQQASDTAKSVVAGDHPAAKADQAQGRVAPQLPDQASDKAKAVTGTVFGGNPADGRDFGAAVSATASGGASGSTPKPSDTGAQKAAENSAAAGAERGSVADEHTNRP